MKLLNVKQSQKSKEFIEKLQKHDWWWMMSDSPDVRRRGEEEEKKLIEEANKSKWARALFDVIKSQKMKINEKKI